MVFKKKKKKNITSENYDYCRNDTREAQNLQNQNQNQKNVTRVVPEITDLFIILYSKYYARNS